MRQGQQNRRGRGRGGNNSSNGNRKSQNPLSRSYESNGPDVKIRGTAAQIAEKYVTLSRDASASGDTVMAENYLQHAEHYNRIIMSAQAASAQNTANADAGHGMNGSQRSQRETNQNLRDQPQPHIPPHPGSEPQPVIADKKQTEAEAQPVEKAGAAEAQQPAAETADGVEEQKKSANGASQAEQPRRRRRRYPSASGSGSSRASASSESTVADRTAAESQSTDEATTA